MRDRIVWHVQDLALGTQALKNRHIHNAKHVAGLATSRTELVRDVSVVTQNNGSRTIETRQAT